jgi:hypothetical protein
MADRLLVDHRELKKFHDVDATVSALTLGDEVGRPPHHRGNLVLRQTCLFPGRDKTLQKDVIRLLELGGSRLSGLSSLRRLTFAHR